MKESLLELLEAEKAEITRIELLMEGLERWKQEAIELKKIGATTAYNTLLDIIGTQQSEISEAENNLLYFRKELKEYLSMILSL